MGSTLKRFLIGLMVALAVAGVAAACPDGSTIPCPETTSTEPCPYTE